MGIVSWLICDIASNKGSTQNVSAKILILIISPQRCTISNCKRVADMGDFGSQAPGGDATTPRRRERRRQSWRDQREKRRDRWEFRRGCRGRRGGCRPRRGCTRRTGCTCERRGRGGPCRWLEGSRRGRTSDAPSQPRADERNERRLNKLTVSEWSSTNGVDNTN